MEIREYLKQAPVLFDGAMGTYYAQWKENPLEKCEMANILEPDSILSIHRQYIEAGCNAIKTNTFQANEATLGKSELAAEALVKGYELACRAAEGREIFVFADIGPIPRTAREDLPAEYRKIVDLFLSLGAKHFLFETFSSGEHLREMAAYIKSKKQDAFILTSFAVSPEGYTRQGISGEHLFREFSRDDNIDALGFNCMSGPFHLLQYIRKLDLGGKIVSVMPNASYPTVINNRTFFGNNAGYFSTQMMEIVRQGARIIGGCCGTTPEFIAKTARMLYKSSVTAVSDNDSDLAGGGKPVFDQTPAAPNRLLEKLAHGKRVIAVELDPPMDTNIGFFMSGARRLKDAGADAITIADCPIARARVDSSMLACKIKRELGIDPLPHMTCRDRNINATKALLLGMNIEGVDNVLVVTGDPVPSAERNEVKSVYNFNSVMLAGYISTLNQEGTFGSPFHICGALNVNAINFDAQLDKAKRKTEHGMTMFLTQPILTKTALENLKRARKVLNAKILGGIIPIVSHRNACFMNNEISGIVVSDRITQLYEDVSKERAAELAVAISTAIANEMSNYVDGYYLITPFKRVDIVCEIMRNIQSGAAPAMRNILETL